MGDHYALVIGINRYKEFTPLRTAVNDAATVAKVLEESYGFKVIVLLDEQATDEAIRDALYGLRAKVGQNDSLLIYFAGHGVLQGGVGYWIPVNRKRKSDANWLEHSAIRTRLVPEWLPAKHILIVADSSYAGALLRAEENPPESITAPYVKQALRNCARQCMTSGGLYPVPDGAGANSVFAKYFVKALENPPGRVFVSSDIFPKVRDNTANNAPEIERGKPQTPILGIVKEAGHEVGGEFVFLYRSATTPTVPPTPPHAQTAAHHGHLVRHLHSVPGSSVRGRPARGPHALRGQGGLGRGQGARGGGGGQEGRLPELRGTGHRAPRPARAVGRQARTRPQSRHRNRRSPTTGSHAQAINH